jgi:Tfp pilus assembly major pilin PilA
MPFELQWGSWVAAAVIGVLSRLQWKYYKKYV